MLALFVFHVPQNVTEWNDHVKPERERSLLWHLIWIESGKPNKGFIYEIMKRTCPQYIMRYADVKEIH